MPEIVSDDQGGAIVVWRDEQSGAYDIRAERITADGRIATGWPEDGIILVLGPRPVFGGLVGDGRGGATATWYTRIDSIDVFAQRVTGSGAPDWPAGGLFVCDAPGGQFNPHIATDGNGGAFIAWSDLRTGDENIYAAHVLATGNLDPGWPVNGALVCAASNVQQNPRLVSDEAGGFIVLWMDFRSGTSYDVYAQRIIQAGSPALGWSQDGEPLCVAPGHQFGFAVIGDGMGGIISAWQDARADGGDVYAQRITAAGSIARSWLADGVLISNAPSFQGGVQLTTDGRQGAMISWVDSRFDQNDVYLQRVSAAGAVGPDIPPPPLPEKFGLLSPRPNPAGEPATFTLRLPTALVVTVDVVDVTGRLVAVLQDGIPLPAGDHTITWDGRDRAGRAVSAGVYVIRARAMGQEASSKLIRL